MPCSSGCHWRGWGWVPIWSWARDAQQSPWAPLVVAQPATARAGNSQSTAGFFNHDTLVLTAGGSLVWEPNLLALCQLWGIFPVWEFPAGEVLLLFGAELRSQPLGLSTLGDVFGKDTYFLLFLSLFDFINSYVTSEILVFTLWLSFPQGCSHVCVIPFIFIIPAAVVTHTFSANRTKGSLCSQLMVQLLCKDSGGHGERLGGTRNPWDNIAWASLVRPQQTITIRVGFMLMRGSQGVCEELNCLFTCSWGLHFWGYRCWDM